jgi:hypothetical protein
VLRAGLDTDLGLPDSPDASLGSLSVLVWSSLIGTITFEVFGQFTNTVADRDRYFAITVDRLATLVGLR